MNTAETKQVYSRPSVMSARVNVYLSMSLLFIWACPSVHVLVFWYVYIFSSVYECLHRFLCLHLFMHEKLRHLKRQKKRKFVSGQMSKGLGMLDGITCQGQRSSRAYRKRRHAPTSPDITQTHAHTHRHANKQTADLHIGLWQATVNQ